MVLVVDINKGIQTQTAECLVIGEIICDKMLVVLNKIDLVPAAKRKVGKLHFSILKIKFSSEKAVDDGDHYSCGSGVDLLTRIAVRQATRSCFLSSNSRPKKSRGYIMKRGAKSGLLEIHNINRPIARLSFNSFHYALKTKRHHTSKMNLRSYCSTKLAEITIVYQNNSS